ncbi:ABC transporter ATP-binding protein [Alteromonas sp. ASW11-130]|uniref:ABC transporter ATP-binding protein n=1 Tax=Alteromonas sp. ASW11-130 TaxID=3015775 RepID=UPI002242BE13|nr:ABC transporter ATP-binding protein [Alteromonas sp. ASW11-130]MCW8093314.1 ABC transporter ATP-binding protein [Alteromonas sp. ASW11-130]
MPSQIQLKNVSQQFIDNSSRITLFSDLNLTIEQGTSYAISGPSGTGKTSLLMIMSGLEKPFSGRLCYMQSNKTRKLDALRNDIGFIFQQFHLLPELSALSNVALPLKLRGEKYAEDKAEEWLAKVGLASRLHHKPSSLSGGEQQRVAIARALVFNPKFIFADEPTGNLDSENANEIADLLFSCCEQHNAALVVVTHSESLAQRAEHVYHLELGTCTQLTNSTLRLAQC